MAKHDDITPERLHADLRHFTQFLQHMEEEGRLLEATPRIMRMMGDLRSKLFAYEVRCTGRLAPSESDPDSDPDSPNAPEGSSGAPGGSAERESRELRESRRIVEEAVQRAREAEGEWSGFGEDEED